MSKTKKIIIVIHILVLSILFIIPANAYSIADIGISINTNTLTLNSSNKIVDSHELINVVDNVENGASYTLEFLDTGSATHLGIAAGILTFTFPEAKYVQGQSYNFSFKLNGSQSNNDTLVYIPNSEYYTTNIIQLGYASLWYKVGDTAPLWSNVIDTITPTAGFDDKTPILYKESKLYNNSVMSCDIVLPSNYNENVYDLLSGELKQSVNNRITVCLVMRTNYITDSITLNDIKITPIGATKLLYSEFEYQENVENELSDINQGLEEQNSQLEDANNKLDEIIGQPEEEKSEAQEGADDALSGILDGVEDKGPGFFRALGGLISAMSYNGTEAKWQVPPIKIPAIDGLWDEIVLTENQEIDFSFWVNKLPEVLLNFIKALLTTALIVYCFKELYETLSYVFTLKKGE